MTGSPTTTSHARSTSRSSRPRRRTSATCAGPDGDAGNEAPRHPWLAGRRAAPSGPAARVAGEAMSTRRSLLREMYLAGDSGQVERFDDLLHHDVIVHAPFGLSTVGLGAEKASWQQALAAMHD